MLNPMEKHMKAAKRVIKYLKQTANTKLVFTKHTNDDITVYANADFGTGDD